MATLKQLIKPEDLARKLDVTTDTLLSWRDKGMPWVKAGKSVFILEGPFMKWIEKNLQGWELYNLRFKCVLRPFF